MPSRKQKAEFISTYGLTQDDSVKDYKSPTTIDIGRTTKETDNNEVFKTKEALQSYCDSETSDKEKAAHLKPLLEEDFDKYNLVVTKTLGCSYRAFSHCFADLYSKNNELYIYLVYQNYLPLGVSVACVVGYEFFYILVDKSVEFDIITTIIEQETDYR